MGQIVLIGILAMGDRCAYLARPDSDYRQNDA